MMIRIIIIIVIIFTKAITNINTVTIITITLIKKGNDVMTRSPCFNTSFSFIDAA